MLADFFPGACSRLKIFLCHAHADRAVAEEIAQALKNDGHTVFFDKDSLPPASDYNEQIRKAIQQANRFLFLISSASLGEGKFTLSELAFARERWPNAEGAVYPVLIDKSVDIASVPAYLRSVHILQVEGNAPVEVVAALDKSRRVSASCVLAAGALALSAIAAGLVFFQQGSFLLPEAKLDLLPPEQVDFRPMTRPASGSAWLDSDVAVTLIPVQYSNKSGRPVRVHKEIAEVEIAGTRWPYKWFNEVEINPKSCAADWLCTKQGLAAETVEPGRTLGRETMFIQEGGNKLKWRAFLDKVFDPAVGEISVSMTSNLESSVMAQVQTSARHTTCRVDLGEVRSMLAGAGFKPGAAPYPPRISPFCRK